MSKWTKIDFRKMLSGVSSVGISGHVRPDGDCVGSTMALYLYLRSEFPEIRTEIYLEPFSDSFSFLKGTGDVKCMETNAPLTRFDLFFCLDCSDLDRLGPHAPLFSGAKRTVCIDHHISNHDFADENYVDSEASSASEVVCDLIGVENVSSDMAEALYLGIVHDTGMFQYSCTSPHTMYLAGALMEKGIDYTRIASDTFFSRSYRQSQLLGKCLLECVPLLGGRILFSALRRKDLKFFDALPSDLNGISSEMRQIRGTDVAVFLYETEPFVFKVSMRSSEKVDVCAVAAHFGGGGHVRAAGLTMQGTVYDVINNLTEQIVKQLEEDR